MDLIILIICFLTLIPLVVLGRRLRSKYENTKALLILQFVWFVMVAATILYFLIPHFNGVQNIITGVFIGGGLVYFFYRFKAVK